MSEFDLELSFFLTLTDKIFSTNSRCDCTDNKNLLFWINEESVGHAFLVLLSIISMTSKPCPVSTTDSKLNWKLWKWKLIVWGTSETFHSSFCYFS